MPSPLKLPTRAVFWDIDGTLLVTGRAGMIAWERALTAQTGAPALPALRSDGLTDYQIAAWLLGHTALDQPASPEAQDAAARLVQRYEHALPDALPLRQGRVLENADTLLAWMRAERPQLLSWLVTGNTLMGATAKLRHYGLSDSFQAVSLAGDVGSALPGAFSVRVEPRAEIVRRALQMAQAQLPDLQPSEALVIGDTPHDIHGAHAVGVPVLAVATHTHSLDELQELRPWRAMAALPGTGEFSDLLKCKEKREK
jgi:phosphoglycolate phosphatase-like HAD superfamily hydrolase